MCSYCSERECNRSSLRSAQPAPRHPEIGQLKQAIDTNDLVRVEAMMTRNPALHTAPLGYGKDGPLTWVAECRVPWEPPRPVRLAMAEWMVTHGSDVHQGGDGPLMRAALNGYRIPMMELLVSRGADVNALWHGHFPIVFAPCESTDPAALKWLLDHGANPNCRDHRYEISDHRYPGTALDYLIASYARSVQRLSACIDILVDAGGETKYDAPPVLAGSVKGRGRVGYHCQRSTNGRQAVAMWRKEIRDHGEKVFLKKVRGTYRRRPPRHLPRPRGCVSTRIAQGVVHPGSSFLPSP
jgi:hypothetical protein